MSSLKITVLAALTAAGCVGTELEVPTNHPGHPQARSGRLPHGTALAPVDPPPPANEAGENDHAGHEHGTGK